LIIVILPVKKVNTTKPFKATKNTRPYLPLYWFKTDPSPGLICILKMKINAFAVPNPQHYLTLDIQIPSQKVFEVHFGGPVILNLSRWPWMFRVFGGYHPFAKYQQDIPVGIRWT